MTNEILAIIIEIKFFQFVIFFTNLKWHINFHVPIAGTTSSTAATALHGIVAVTSGKDAHNQRYV